MTALELNPGRKARLDLAIWDAIAARDGADAEVFLRSVEDLVELNHRLRTEQLAELGHLPWTVEGCIAVLHVATRIVGWFSGDDADA